MDDENEKQINIKAPQAIKIFLGCIVFVHFVLWLGRAVA